MKIKIIFVLTAILTLAFLMPNAAFSPAEINTKEFDYDDAYNWAEEAGFSTVFLEDISEEALKKVYFDNITAEEITVTNAVDTMTGGDLAEKDINCASDSVVQKSGGKVIGTNIYFTAHWKNGMPMNRLTDGVTSHWGDNWIFKDHSFWGLVEDVPNNGGANESSANFS